MLSNSRAGRWCLDRTTHDAPVEMIYSGPIIWCFRNSSLSFFVKSNLFVILCLILVNQPPIQQLQMQHN